jgi:2-polyprenyl-3-methyl-5-hydroxy-6-metoxy-1,4-benzoquinol methylase
VFCTEVLEHVLPSEESLPRLLRLLRPGGTLVLTVPDGRRDLSPAGHSIADGHSYAGHVNFWGAESWRYYVGRHADGRSFDTGALDNGEKLYAVIHDRRERAGHDTDRRA